MDRLRFSDFSMGAPDKQVYQILGEDQKAAKTAKSAPGCFVHGKDVFSEPVGNAVQFFGPSQKSLKNPICKALGDRITRAIYDGKPFHVYMVLPVHPEGTLDTINIMTQQHLTMQSLVFGSHVW